LVPTVGWQSTAVSSLFNAPSQLWAAGLSATQTLFDAGRTGRERAHGRAGLHGRGSHVPPNRAQRDGRSENGITGLTSLDRAATQANASVDSAQRALDIANGATKEVSPFTWSVLTAEQALLGNQRKRADPWHNS